LFGWDASGFPGGAPVTEQYSIKINADGYSPDPQRLAEHLKSLQAATADDFQGSWLWL